MNITIIRLCNLIIQSAFYALFFLVPIVFTDKTSELFEFNKMWLTFGLTLVIAAAWISKMIVKKQFFIQKTPLDIPLALFVLSHIISTIHSLDPHVSLWGYYSRFNGGLLSILSFIFLYYAFVSNLNKTVYVKRSIIVTLASAFFVALWGLPSHFGYDPTCAVLRFDENIPFWENFNVKCWTPAFQPKVRIFSTLGQPNWLAAYLAVFIPISIAFAIRNFKSEAPNPKQSQMSKMQNTKHDKSFDYLNLNNLNLFRISIFEFVISFSLSLLLSSLLFLDLVFTGSRSGFLGLLSGLILFYGFVISQVLDSLFVKIAVFISGGVFLLSLSLSLFLNLPNASSLSVVSFATFTGIVFYSFLTSQKLSLKPYLLSLFGISIVLLGIAFYLGTPVNEPMSRFLTTSEPSTQKQKPQQAPVPQGPLLETGGTESGNIRKIVWQGALDIWKANPIFGTGVETFAFAYYKHRPVAHNLTSEWDYLYNKAHNEYLNYLATTGAFGLGSYLLIISNFLFFTLREFKTQSSKLKTTAQNSKLYKEKLSTLSSNFDPDLIGVELYTLNFALITSYVTILVSNFFGFSVVIINIYFFLIPAFVFILLGMLDPKQQYTFPQNTTYHLQPTTYHLSYTQWTFISVTLIVSLFQLFTLYNFWQADQTYAYGFSRNRQSLYLEAEKPLEQAVIQRGNEPVFKDELSINKGILSILAVYEKDVTQAAQLAYQAKAFSDEITTQYPNNVVFWKSRVRIFHALAEIDSAFLPEAIRSIERAQELAPTDAAIMYNRAILYSKNNQKQKAVDTLKKTIEIKSNYADAYYALGLLYRELAVDTDSSGVEKKETVIKPEFQKLAEENMQKVLKIHPNDAKAKEALKNWKEK